MGACVGAVVGLVAVTPAAGFITVQNRLSGEGLEEYIRPIGGGYFFVPPGRAARGEPFAAALFD